MIRNFNFSKISFFVLCIILLCIGLTKVIKAQTELESSTLKIIDPSIDSGGGISESTNLALISSQGNSLSDARLESGSYALGSGFPNGILANVPSIQCFETDTNSSTTDCLNFPNANGATGECGTPGCYDRAKLEINPENNPVDTLYLVALQDNSTNIQYYLQSDHTLDISYDINDYMSICDIEGKDERALSGCENSSDTYWDEDLQKSNIFNLNSNTTYTLKVRALSGDFTETQYSQTLDATTLHPALSLDIDIGTVESAETSAPHSVSFGTLTLGAVTTATNQVWIDMGTNIILGMTTYIKDQNNGLTSGSSTIPSETEDLDNDGGLGGGYGAKVNYINEDSLGPLIAGSTYSTAETNGVGALSTSNTILFQTDDSGSSLGQITGGRGSFYLKALAPNSLPSGNYSDTLTITMVANF